MKNSKRIAIVFFMFVLISSCKQRQEARRPVSQASGSFMKKSVVRNKKLVADEETQIQNVIKSNPNVKYIASKKGYCIPMKHEMKWIRLRQKKEMSPFLIMKSKI